MSYEDQVLALVREGNPIPDPDALAIDQVENAVYLATLEQRSSEMTQLETKQPEHESTNRPWVPLLVAAVAVIVLGVVLVLMNQGAEEPPVATEPTPTTVAESSPTTIPADDEAVMLATAESFIEARAAWDGESVRSLLANDAEVSGEFVDSVDELLAMADWERAVGWSYSDPQCSVRSPGEVRCTYVMDLEIARALGLDPYPGNNFDLIVEGDRIQRVTHNFNAFDVIPDAWDPFLIWVGLNHPEDVALMYVAPTGIDEVRAPLINPESIALWEAYTAEFAAEQAGS